VWTNIAPSRSETSIDEYNSPSTVMAQRSDVQSIKSGATGPEAGIRTQSWDVALTDRGPVILEVNFGGDLNLHQLAHGAEVLDPFCDTHLRRCGYRLG
jgi:hypothetical protein